MHMKKNADDVESSANDATTPFQAGFTCFLPAKIGVLPLFFLRRLFAGVRTNPDLASTITGLPDQAAVVYVSKAKSYFEFLYYFTRYMQEGLPFPQLCFDCSIRIWQPIDRLARIFITQVRSIVRRFRLRDPYRSGYIRNKIANGTTAFLPLLEKRDFYRSFVKSKADPIRHLIDIQRSIDRPICLIPQVFLFSKKPASTWPTLVDIFFGPPQKPGKWRRLATLFNNPDSLFIEIGDPVNLKQYLALPQHRDHDDAYLALQLRRDLLNQINATRRSITGPTVKMPEEIRQDILTGEELRQFMVTYAKRREITIFDAHREAIGYVDEIAAKYSPSFINLAHRFLRFFLGMVFESVTFNRDMLARIKRMARNGPIVFVPAHKSHMDSLLLLYTLYDNHMPCPHTFAGINLAFWPMGSLFRKGGAFFVRRSFKGAVFYAKVFSAYIFRLLKEGFNIAVYIEGTRSRSGKLLQPQLGMLNILMNAFFENACPDLIFVPVFISYDRIPDENSYLHEISGGKKTPENFRQMLKAKALLKNRYGSVHINFGQPFNLNGVLGEKGLSANSLTSREKNRLCRDIGSQLMSAIDRQSVVTPQSLIAGALLSGGKEIVTGRELMFRIDASMNLLVAQEAQLADSLAQGHQNAVEGAIKHYLGRKFIQGVDNPSPGREQKDAWRIIENRRNALDYYKNISICHFIPTAFTAMAVLEKDAFQFSAADLHETYRHLLDLLSEEFNADPIHPPAYIVRKTVKAFIDNAILVPHPIMPDTYNLSSEGFRKLIFFAGYIEPFLESYRTALVYFSKNRRNHHDRSKMLKKMLGIGNRMHKQGEIRLRESISKANYGNAINFFSKRGVRGSEDEEKIRGWSDTLQRYQNIISR
jgi:glycerol-3-phosphate O-acyltransferase